MLFLIIFRRQKYYRASCDFGISFQTQSRSQGGTSYKFFGVKKSFRISWKNDEKLSWPWGTKNIARVDGHIGRHCIQANGIRDLTCPNRRALFYSGKWYLPQYKVAPEAWFLIIIPQRHSDSLRKVAPMSKSQGGKNAVSVLTSESTSPGGRRARNMKNHEIFKKWPEWSHHQWFDF